MRYYFSIYHLHFELGKIYLTAKINLKFYNYHFIYINLKYIIDLTR